jgi:hypothetical protein
MWFNVIIKTASCDAAYLLMLNCKKVDATSKR